MSTPIRASGRDLRALAAMVSENRTDLPDGDGLLPPSLLADLRDQIRCDEIMLDRNDLERRSHLNLQHIRAPGDDRKAAEPDDPAVQEHFWACHMDSLPCSYPERTGDLRRVVTVADFHSVRQWHSTAMYTDFYRPFGTEHDLQLSLPDPAARLNAARTIRLWLFRGPGPDFRERDRAVLTLLRPHLQQACQAAEQRRHPRPRLTPRQTELLHLVAAGHTNTQIARQLGISEGTVRTHLETIYQKLGVSSRTAAVTRALADRID